jgi:pyruvate dehydrogenase E2 component (dihydrolipoamide acetyltransferase)
MPVEFKLPDVGEGVAEGELVQWLVEPGDTVSEDQPVAEVETDKAVVEVPSPVNGTVKELRAEEGEVVPVGNVLIVFEVEGEEPEDVEVEPEPADEAEGDTDEAATAPAGNGESGGRVFAAPSARRLARELDVDIATVEGSGPGGRVTEQDVRAAAESETGSEESEQEQQTERRQAVTRRSESTDGETAGEPAGPTASAGASVEAAGRNRTLAAPATRKLAEEEGVDIDDVPATEERDGEAFVTPEAVREYARAQQEAQAADAEAVAGEVGAGEARASATATGQSITPGEDERIPYRGVRRTIGKQMEQSKFTAPHVTHHDQVDVTNLVEARGELKERAADRGIDLSYMPFVVKAVIAALREYPILNSQLDEDNEEIVVRGDYNIGVATATEAGLMVPVVTHADQKSMLSIASEMNELVQKARERSIAREEMQGGTFTLTNFGAIGGEYATPIINYPETAILGLGAIKDRPWVHEGEVVPRKVMTLSLSIDHRVIDGAEAAQFTNTLKEYLQNPTLLLLE